MLWPQTTTDNSAPVVTHVNSRPDAQYQFNKVVNLGPPIHQSKLSNENCNILQRLTISKFCRNGSNSIKCFILKLLRLRFEKGLLGRNNKTFIGLPRT